MWGWNFGGWGVGEKMHMHTTQNKTINQPVHHAHDGAPGNSMVASGADSRCDRVRQRHGGGEEGGASHLLLFLLHHYGFMAHHPTSRSRSADLTRATPSTRRCGSSSARWVELDERGRTRFHQQHAPPPPAGGSSLRPLHEHNTPHICGCSGLAEPHYAQAFELLSMRDDVRAVVVCGRGKHFTAGIDLSFFAASFAAVGGSSRDRRSGSGSGSRGDSEACPARLRYRKRREVLQMQARTHACLRKKGGSDRHAGARCPHPHVHAAWLVGFCCAAHLSPRSRGRRRFLPPKQTCPAGVLQRRRAAALAGAGRRAWRVRGGGRRPHHRVRHAVLRLRLVLLR